MASVDVISSIQAVIGYIFCKKMLKMVFFMNTPTGVGWITVGSVYRPPGKPIGEFNQFMDETLESLHDSPAVVLGDFNLNTLSLSSDSLVQNYSDIFSQHSFVNEINLLN